MPAACALASACPCTHREQPHRSIPAVRWAAQLTARRTCCPQIPKLPKMNTSHCPDGRGKLQTKYLGKVLALGTWPTDEAGVQAALAAWRTFCQTTAPLKAARVAHDDGRVTAAVKAMAAAGSAACGVRGAAPGAAAPAAAAPPAAAPGGASASANAPVRHPPSCRFPCTGAAGQPWLAGTPPVHTHTHSLPATHRQLTPRLTAGLLLCTRRFLTAQDPRGSRCRRLGVPCLLVQAGSGRRLLWPPPSRPLAPLLALRLRRLLLRLLLLVLRARAARRAPPVPAPLVRCATHPAAGSRALALQQGSLGLLAPHQCTHTHTHTAYPRLTASLPPGLPALACYCALAGSSQHRIRGALAAAGWGCRVCWCHPTCRRERVTGRG